VATQLVRGGFTRPLGVANAGDGSGRLFVVEQPGQVRVVQPDGTIGATPFLDISSQVLFGGERGLLGLAFHPGYAENGRFFVYYTRLPNGENTVSEFRVSTAPDQADATSERMLMSVPDPAANHNGGALAFGPDGYLYVAMGDGGGQNDQFGNGQNLNALLGKIHRIDVDAPPAAGRAYAIPADNPFAAGGGAPEIWAYGVRNPWRITFDRATGDLYIADVGGSAGEEINRQPAGAAGGLNYGWPLMEGSACRVSSCPAGLVTPIAAYDHSLGCTVIGGYVYRGAGQPAMTAAYFFADWCSGIVFTLDLDGGSAAVKQILNSGLGPSSFGEDEAGELYLVDHDAGGLYRVVAP
jgi:glucose/arabinose dehydrogenase